MKQANATLLLLAAAFGIGYTSYAQFLGAEPLVLTIVPSYPKPFESVTIVPQSSAIDLSASTVTVSVNGQVVSKGTGAEAAYVTAGAAGTATTVTVTAVSGGQTYTKTITLRPADVALVVEPATTVHPLYEGGSLIASEGQVRLVAIPDVRTSSGNIPAANLVYTWRNGEQILQSESGIGKSVLTATSPVRYRDARVTVTVSSQDRSVVAESSVTIAPANPLIRVYRNDPLLGPLYSTALSGNVQLLGAEETYRAVPYFFPGPPSMTWLVNNAVSDTDSDITVRSSGEGSGRAFVRVVGGSGTEAAESTFAVDFGIDDGFNFFGL